MNANTFQDRVGDWMKETFSDEVRNDKRERALRFLEESLELCQSLGLGVAHAERLMNYIFNRPVGDTDQELGGVMVTLSALSETAKLDMYICGEIELERINKPEVKAKIQAKQVTRKLDGIAVNKD